MLIDSRSQLCAKTALNGGGAGSYLIGSQIDLGPSPTLKDPNDNGQLYLVGIVRTAADSSGGTLTVAFALRSDDSESVHVSSSTPHIVIPAIAEANLTAGKVICRQALPRGRNYERFLGIVQTTAGEAATAGAVDFFITTDPGKYEAYPEGASI